MNFNESIKTCLTKKYSTFSGRASRSEFWFFYLFILIGYIVSFILIVTISVNLFWVMGIFILAMVIPAFAVTARRLHDINKSGWFQLLPLPAGLLEALFATTSESLEILFLIIGLGLLSHGANLLIFIAGGYGRGNAPILEEGYKTFNSLPADPLPQALILTAIVISFAVTAFALTLFLRTVKSTGTDDVDTMLEDNT